MVLIKVQFYQMVNLLCIFISYNVKEGKYVLNIFSPSFSYKKFFLEVKGNKIFSYYYNNNKNRIALNYPLKLPSGNSIVYFEERKSFDISVFLKSPMGIIIFITVLMLICLNSMPDLEELKKQEEEEKEKKEQENNVENQENK